LKKINVEYELKDDDYFVYLGYEFICIKSLTTKIVKDFFKHFYDEECPRYWEGLESLHKMAGKKCKEEKKRYFSTI
jgi:hypothetical protein